MSRTPFDPSLYIPAGYEREYGITMHGPAQSPYTPQFELRAVEITREIHQTPGTRWLQEMGTLGRVYVDLGNHPEVSGHEHVSHVKRTFAQVGADALVQQATLRAMQKRAEEGYPEEEAVMSVCSLDDNLETFSGQHMNIRMRRETFMRLIHGVLTSKGDEDDDFGVIDNIVSSDNPYVLDMASYIVSAGLVHGAGTVIARRGKTVEHVPYHRLLRIESLIGRQTTSSRPLINTRDESHDDDEFCRLHVITNDALVRPSHDVSQAISLISLVKLLEMGKRLPWHIANPVRVLHLLKQNPNASFAVTDGEKTVEMTGYHYQQEITSFMLSEAEKYQFPADEVKALGQKLDALEGYTSGERDTKRVDDVMPWVKPHRELAEEGILGVEATPKMLERARSIVNTFTSASLSAENGIRYGSNYAGWRPQRVVEAAIDAAMTPPEETRAAERVRAINLVVDTDEEGVHYGTADWQRVYAGERDDYGIANHRRMVWQEKSVIPAA